MLGDPLTLSSQALNYTGSYPAASETAIQSKAFNIIESVGRKIVRSISKGDLVSLALAGFKITTSHQPTKGKRVRSLLRIDVEKLDAALVGHSVSVQLVIDQEEAATAETNACLSRAIGTMVLLLVTASTTNILQSTQVLTDLLNGES